MKIVAIASLAAICSPFSSLALGQTDTQPEREEIIVIGTTPLPGSDIDRDKIPGTTQLLSAGDFEKITRSRSWIRYRSAFQDWSLTILRVTARSRTCITAVSPPLLCKAHHKALRSTRTESGLMRRSAIQ